MAFWATQLCAGDYNVCAAQECGRLGLAITPPLSRADEGGSASIATDGWVKGLVFNILAVTASNDQLNEHCANNRGGYWADSFTGNASGSRLQEAMAGGVTAAEKANLAAAAVRAALAKLVDLGVAEKVDVVVVYAGGGLYRLSIIVDTEQMDYGV